MLGCLLLFFPFPLRPEGPQIEFEGPRTLGGCVLLGDELQKDEPLAPCQSGLLQSLCRTRQPS